MVFDNGQWGCLVILNGVGIPACLMVTLMVLNDGYIIIGYGQGSHSQPSRPLLNAVSASAEPHRYPLGNRCDERYYHHLGFSHVIGGPPKWLVNYYR